MGDNQTAFSRCFRASFRKWSGGIARTGSPRCCKRDSRIAVDEATRTFNNDFGCNLSMPDRTPICRSMEANSV
ncbi:MAG: DUF5714 domain-containing protein [Tractidigestivibacter sp.]|jgi:hypothetical protein|uniref:DUF5714 domain-containing protein n=1 Tax=Tractidigestivibacter sp. TaxID=2847320 RepID=UPI003D8B36C6